MLRFASVRSGPSDVAKKPPLGKAARRLPDRLFSEEKQGAENGVCKSTDCRLFEAVVVIVNYSEC